MEDMTYLVLTQYRESGKYNDFTGKYYHFPGTGNKNYFNLFNKLPIEFVYYEPDKKGKGEFFGYGKIIKPPFEDKREKGYYFVEISEYRPFSNPVSFKNSEGQLLEQVYVPEFYNAQNAVRKTTAKFIEEICLDGGIILNFKADAHLIKVLGEQLIASEKVGILELIKNAYDARASECTVRIEKVYSLPKIDDSFYKFNNYEGPVIVIEDDGIGMTREVIENGWLRPASTIKTNVKERLKQERNNAIKTGSLGTYESLIKELKKEYRDRIPLGEKGVGRFATHRLGKNLIIKSKVKDLDYEYVLKINWDLFDELSEVPIDLNSIGISLTRQKPSRDYGKTNSGTQVIIYGGRVGFLWDEETIKALNSSISKLNSPNPNIKKNKNVFSVKLECPQIPDLCYEDIVSKYDPIFTLEGLVDENGILDYTLKFIPPKSVPMTPDEICDREFDLKSCDIKYWKPKTNENGYRKPGCGSFYLHVDVWYRTKPWIEGPNMKEFIDYLDNYGGLSIYRDGINIFPAEWGANTDWLDLSTRHIKQHFRMSYYNMIGNIEIDQIDNLDLVDKTDREGLINNQAYNDLARLVKTIIEKVIELQFTGKRDKFNDLTSDITRDPKTLINFTKQSERIVKNIKDNYPVIEDPFDILREIGLPPQRKDSLINLERSIKNLQKSLELIDEQKDLLTEQAGFGLGIAVSLHEVAKITSNFYYGINEILKKKVINEDILKELRESSSSLRTELKRLSPLRAIRSEPKTEFNISKAINYAYEVFKRKFNKLNISFVISKDNDFQVHARYGAIIQIFSNLFDNSCYWLETKKSEQREIQIDIDTKYRTINIADSGPGIHEAILPYLFQAGYSLKIPASGLGLYICKYYMQSFKGDIYLTHNKERLSSLPGAQFTIDFSKVAESKEG